MRIPWWLPVGRVDTVSVDRLASMLSRNERPQPLLIDVREPREFEDGHIAGAKNIPIRELPKRLDTLALDCSKPIVAICLSGHRSVPAYRLLARSGCEKVYSLDGGMLAWWRAKLPTTKDGKN